MNWLAHLYLSEPDAGFRIGNLLPDMVSMAALADLPETWRRGVDQHYRIDACTDAHPLVRGCFGRFQPPLRRFAGILTDVFFDHCLALDWRQFSSAELSTFTAEVYASFDSHSDLIPPEARPVLERMREEDWLGSYQTIPGIEGILHRMSRRLRRPVNLSAAIPVLEAHYDAFRADFHAFFPELRRTVCPPQVSDSRS